MTEHVSVPKKLTREIGDAMLAAMWPSGEIIFDDSFDGPEQQLSAAWDAMLSAAPTPPSTQPVAPSEAATRVCHDEQMISWTGDIVGRLSMEGWLKDDLSYADVIEIHSSVADEIKDIVKSAFAHPELEKPPTPPVSLDEILEVLEPFAGDYPVTEDDFARARALYLKLKEMGTPDTSPSVKQE